MRTLVLDSANIGELYNKRKNYLGGKRNGHLDRVAGREPSTIALTCPEHSLPGYADGYKAGYYTQG
jgi:hypothetical protein